MATLTLDKTKLFNKLIAHHTTEMQKCIKLANDIEKQVARKHSHALELMLNRQIEKANEHHDFARDIKIILGE